MLTCSDCRSISAINLTRVILVAKLDAADFTYSFAYAAILAGLEVNIGITSACMVTFGPLILREKFGVNTRWIRRLISRSRFGLLASSKGAVSGTTIDQRPFESLGDDDILLREAVNPSLNIGGIGHSIGP